MSISTIATSGVDSSSLDGLTSGVGGQHIHTAALQNAAEREDVAHVIVDDQHLLADQRLIGAVQAVKHCCFSREGR